MKTTKEANDCIDVVYAENKTRDMMDHINAIYAQKQKQKQKNVTDHIGVIYMENKIKDMTDHISTIYAKNNKTKERNKSYKCRLCGKQNKRHDGLYRCYLC